MHAIYECVCWCVCYLFMHVCGLLCVCTPTRALSHLQKDWMQDVSELLSMWLQTGEMFREVWLSNVNFLLKLKWIWPTDHSGWTHIWVLIIKMLTHAHTHAHKHTHTHTPHSNCQASRACSHQIKEMPLQTLSCGNVYQNGTKSNMFSPSIQMKSGKRNYN